MKTIKNVIWTILISIYLSSCETTLDVLAEINETDSNWYDKTKCEHGYPSEPGVTRREGCVNSQTSSENYEEFRRYQIERAIYLEQADE